MTGSGVEARGIKKAGSGFEVRAIKGAGPGVEARVRKGAGPGVEATVRKEAGPGVEVRVRKGAGLKEISKSSSSSSSSTDSLETNLPANINQCCGSGSGFVGIGSVFGIRIRIHTCNNRIKWRQKMLDLRY